MSAPLLYAFVTRYPSAFKPYYDTQFADLLKRGYDLRILAQGPLDSVLNEKVIRYGLHERVERYPPDALRPLHRFIPAALAALARDPRRRARAALEIRRVVPTVRYRIAHAVRMLTLPPEHPELCLVHGIRTLVAFPWLRVLYPGAPVAVYYHGGEPEEAGGVDAGQVAAGFRYAHVVLTNTVAAREEAISRGCPADRVEVLPVGFDLDEYRPPAGREYRPRGTLRLISAGRLSEGKGHLDLLAAIHQLVREGVRDLHLDIVGDGPLRERVEREVAGRGLAGQVAFLGTLGHAALISALGRADALVLASHPVGTWRETQATVVQEAMLMQALVITTRTGGVPESIAPEMQSFTAACGDPGGLAEALRRLHALPRSALREIGRAGREWTERRYDIAQLNQRMLRAIRDRADPHRPPPGPASKRLAPTAAAVQPLTL